MGVHTLNADQVAEAILADSHARFGWGDPNMAPSLDVGGGRYVACPGDGNAAHGFEAARDLRTRLVAALRRELLAFAGEHAGEGPPARKIA